MVIRSQVLLTPTAVLAVLVLVMQSFAKEIQVIAVQLLVDLTKVFLKGILMNKIFKQFALIILATACSVACGEEEQVKPKAKAPITLGSSPGNTDPGFLSVKDPITPAPAGGLGGAVSFGGKVMPTDFLAVYSVVMAMDFLLNSKNVARIKTVVSSLYLKIANIQNSSIFSQACS